MIPLPGEYKAIAYAVIVLCIVGLIGGACFYHVISVKAAEARAEKAEAATRQAEERNAELDRRVRASSAEVEAANRAAKAAQEEVRKWGEIARNAAQDRSKNREAVNHAFENQKSVVGPAAAPSCACEPCAAPPALWARARELFGLRDAVPAAAAGGGASAPGLPSSAAPEL